MTRPVGSVFRRKLLRLVTLLQSSVYLGSLVQNAQETTPRLVSSHYQTCRRKLLIRTVPTAVRNIFVVSADDDTKVSGRMLTASQAIGKHQHVSTAARPGRPSNASLTFSRSDTAFTPLYRKRRMRTNALCSGARARRYTRKLSRQWNQPLALETSPSPCIRSPHQRFLGSISTGPHR